ncbi:hypothetical protein K5X82_13235 [Halosquirtibacter xylanolyticus]|uniref:hypothetical protein n=1 Tax=Halosquirtibacter xylanolyticus TaxID=3374599 RepID=UPI00374A3F95|nr:hypothetical protein K5X82_13235 [Prolixibacteraceae bacterium]
MRDGLLKNIGLLLLGVALCSSMSVLGQDPSSSLNELPSGTTGAKDTPLVCTKGMENTFSVDASSGYDLGADDYKNDMIKWTVVGGVISPSTISTKEEVLSSTSRSTITVKWNEIATLNNGYVDVQQTSRDLSGNEHCSAVTSRLYIRLNTKPVVNDFTPVDLNKCAAENDGKWSSISALDFSGVTVSDVNKDRITKRYKIINNETNVEVFEDDIRVVPPTLSVGTYRVILIVSDGYCSVESGKPVYNLIVNKTPSPSEIRY